MGEVIIADNTVTGAGVVLAQRVEQLSEPGGVCITAAIHEGLPKRLPFDQADMGEQQVKGFDEPVRVYGVKLLAGEPIPLPQEIHQPKVPPKLLRLAVAVTALVIGGGLFYWLSPWEPRDEPASMSRMAYPLPDKPSIAVLPFVNMSDDAQQEYFVDGMTEDLITDLSKLSGLFVIARNSVFTYKDKAVKVRQVAEELGVRYVLEGSVRRVGTEVRINAQLIDALSGGHVWAERYDGSLTDVFALQDKITRSIVTALAVNLTTGEQERQARQETESAEAYDAFLRGWAHYQLHTPDDLAKAIPYFENAIELDPSFGHAHAALAATYRAVWDNLWAKKVGVSYPEADEKMRRHLEAALSKPTPLAHRMAAKMYSATKRWDEAIAEAERAIALDANDPNGYEEMSRLLVKAGRPGEALDFIEKAMRLDPQTDYLYRLGDVQFHLERYEEAAATFLRATKRNPDDEWNFLLLAAAYGHLGREQEAKSAIDRFSEKRTKEERQYTSLSNLAFTDFKEQIDSNRLLEGLRKAGLPVGGAEPSVVKGKFSVPVNHSEVAQDWNTQGYSCNLYLADRGWVSRNHKHPSDEIVTVVEGRVALIIGDKRFEAGPGDELLIPSHTRHRLENLHDGDLIIPYGLRVDVGTPSNKCQ
jgi:TolB-like protein/quercetin dioxygenase-like cupin family protein/thioredoxin-like negative regulator of GroEL